jgi:hypothetical protein
MTTFTVDITIITVIFTINVTIITLWLVTSAIIQSAHADVIWIGIRPIYSAVVLLSPPFINWTIS